ncbi:MAG: tripartite tricarboxylate transporter TctB family protein [Candidatus Limnocylindria bacterium]
MTLRHPDAIGGLAVVALGVVVLAGALTTPDVQFGVVGPAVLPSVFGILVVLSGLWLTAVSLRADPPVIEALDARPLTLAVIAVALYFAAFVPLGFIVSSVAFFFGLSWILGSRAVLRDAVASVGFVLALYVLFERLLTVDLPGGVLPL